MAGKIFSLNTRNLKYIFAVPNFLVILIFQPASPPSIRQGSSHICTQIKGVNNSHFFLSEALIILKFTSHTLKDISPGQPFSKAFWLSRGWNWSASEKKKLKAKLKPKEIQNWHFTSLEEQIIYDKINVELLTILNSLISLKLTNNRRIKKSKYQF